MTSNSCLPTMAISSSAMKVHKPCGSRSRHQNAAGQDWCWCQPHTQGYKVSGEHLFSGTELSVLNITILW
jgi:hypothetical protein